MSDESSSELNESQDFMEADPFQFTKKKFRQSKKSYESSSSDDDDDDDDDDDSDGNVKVLGGKRKRRNLDIDCNFTDSESGSPIKISNVPESHEQKESIAHVNNQSCFDLLSSDEDDIEISIVQTTHTTSSKYPNISSTNESHLQQNPKNRFQSINRERNDHSTLTALEKAHAAREKLKKAQMTGFDTTMYDDIQINALESPHAIDGQNDKSSNLQILSASMSKPKPSSFVESGITPNLGPIIRLLLRTSHVQQDSFKIRKNEQFESLKTSFRNKYQLPVTNDDFEIKFRVDGETIKMSHSPQFYDLEDGDLIDVIFTNKYAQKISLESVMTSSRLSPIHHKSSCFTPANNRVKTNPESIYQVVLKTRIVQPKSTHSSFVSTLPSAVDLWQITCSDPFEKLVKAFANKRNIANPDTIILEYEKNQLALSSSPKSVGMVGGSTTSNPIILDVKLTTNENNSTDSPANLNGTNINLGESKGKKLFLKLRINGENSNTQQLSLGALNKFDFLIEKFCNKNKMNKNEVTFFLDGEKLNHEATPQGEDLEGGEIIDVLIRQNTTKASIKTVPVAKQVQNIQIIIKTIRNKAKTRPKQFSLKQNDTILTLKREYIKYYEKKGCRSVKFYYNNHLVQEGENPSTFYDMGVKNLDCFHAMENGRKF